jgi:uncharacterized HAD superfamily protein
MRIGVDLDEVLADYLTAVLKYYNPTKGTNLKREDFFSYDFWKVWGGTVEEMIDELYAFYQSPYFKSMGLVKGAKEGIEELRKNHDLFIITSRQDDISEVTRNWVEENFPGVFSGVYFVNNYSRSGQRRTKVEVCDQLKIEVLLEDQTKYALECVSDNRKVILFDYPWNQELNQKEGIFRVDDWPKALKLINDFNNK